MNRTQCSAPVLVVGILATVAACFAMGAAIGTCLYDRWRG